MKKKYSKVPLGIRIVSIIYYIGAGIFALTALGLIIVGIVIMANPDLALTIKDLPDFVIHSGNMGASVLFLGVIIGLLAVLAFFVARGIYNGKRWARILVKIFIAIGIVTGFRSLFLGETRGILNLIFSVAVGGYLLFSKKAKEFFS